MGSNTFRNCEFCTYSWTAKVENPKSCPRCKRRFDYKEARLVLEALGREYGYNLIGESQ